MSSEKILLAIIVSLCIIILIVFTYHLYATFVVQDVSLSVVSQPLNRSNDVRILIPSLPTFVVGSNGNDKVECSVCLSLLEEKDTAKMLPNCKHVFHVTCIDTWLTTCSTCPVCRTEVEPSRRIEPEPREGPVGDGASVLAVASSSDCKTSV